MNLKKLGIYLLYFIPWLLSGFLFSSDSSYYNSLNLPIFAPTPIIFPIIWTILYLLIAYSIYQVRKETTSNYKIYLTINYISNQLFTFCFFTLKNNFLALTDTLIILLSSLYLFLETKTIKKKSSWYLIPYIIWNIFALILIFSVFIMN